MGIISVKHNGVYYEFEKSNDETEDILKRLSGARTIACENKAMPVEAKTTFENNVIDGVYNDTNTDDIVLYSPKSKEILNFILRQPQYKHTTKAILAYFNQEVDVSEITLSGGNESIKKAWYGVLQKLRPMHKKIEKSESGKWIKERVGQETVFTFEKY